MPSHACCLLALCLAVSSAYRLQLSTPTPRACRSRLPRLSSADPPPDDRDNDTKMEDDALAAAFAARLEQEGGATQFKIKTTIGGAADELKDGAGKVVGSAKDLASVGKDGLLNADAWQLVVGLLAATVLFTVVNGAARSGDNVDRFTSDGTPLEFGQRSQQGSAAYDPYKPQYGVGR